MLRLLSPLTRSSLRLAVVRSNIYRSVFVIILSVSDPTGAVIVKGKIARRLQLAQRLSGRADTSLHSFRRKNNAPFVGFDKEVYIKRLCLE